MTFVRAMWHSLKVLAAALYWLLSACLVWAGLAQMGTAPRWGWACLMVVLGVFAARGLVLKRASAGVRDLAGCAIFLAFMLMAAAMTGYWARHS